MPDHQALLARTEPERADEDAALNAFLLAVEQGRADLDAGRFVSPQELEEWIEALGAPHPRPTGLVSVK